MARVFLSYAREDAARVAPIARALEAAGHNVWWDQRIGGGEQFAHAIEKALDSAEVVVAVWTEAAGRSPWVRDEAAAGRDRGILVPVCFDSCVPPLGFRQFQAIDLGGWNGKAKSKALEPLKRAVEAKAAGADEDAIPRASTVQGAARLQKRWAAVAALLAIVALGALLVPRIGAWAGTDSVAPKVELGAFAASSAGMSQGLRDEITAAFGAENAVAVTTAGTRERGNAPFLLDGSIRQIGDALRFTVNLRDQGSGTVLWSRAFDRAAADPLATRQVGVAASQVVRCGLWGAAAYPKRMPDEALALYLQLCNEQWGGSPDEERILDAARKVTVALPDFSFGWSALALAAVPLSQSGDLEAAALRAEALAAARKASALDDLNPEGYMAEAGLLPIARFAEREALLKKAISVRPTECGCERMAYGDFLTSVGRLEEAVDQYERAQAMMPLAPFTNVRLAHSLHLVGRHSDAAAIVDQMLKVWPDAVTLRLVKLKSALWTGSYDKALAMLKQQGLHLSEAESEALGATFEALRSGNPAARASALAGLEALASDPRRNDRLVIAALAALGEHAAAIDAAQRLIRARGHMAADVLFEPNLARASGSPDYARLVGGLGLAGYWRSTRSLPDICRGSASPAYCASA